MLKCVAIFCKNIPILLMEDCLYICTPFIAFVQQVQLMWGQRVARRVSVTSKTLIRISEIGNIIIK